MLSRRCVYMVIRILKLFLYVPICICIYCVCIYPYASTCLCLFCICSRIFVYIYIRVLYVLYAPWYVCRFCMVYMLCQCFYIYLYHVLKSVFNALYMDLHNRILFVYACMCSIFVLFYVYNLCFYMSFSNRVAYSSTCSYVVCMCCICLYTCRHLLSMFLYCFYVTL